MLLRVRDEIHLSMLSYQTLLESAIGYGIRKAIILEQQQNQILLDGDLERIKNVELAKKVRPFASKELLTYSSFRLKNSKNNYNKKLCRKKKKLDF